jgi:hypothetical protein
LPYLIICVQALLQYTVSSCAQAHNPSSTQQQQQQAAPLDPFLQDQGLAAALHVGEGFDSEQVWLQLDMQLAPLRKRLRKLLGQIDGSSSSGGAEAAAAAGLRLVSAEVEAGIDAVLGGSDSGSDAEDEDEDDADGFADGDEPMRSDDDDLQEAAAGEAQGQAAAAAGGRRKPLPTEDRCAWGTHLLVYSLLCTAHPGLVLRAAFYCCLRIPAFAV